MTDVQQTLIQPAYGQSMFGGVGPSDYDLWLAAGHVGSIQDFFDAMIAAAGLTVTGAAGQSVTSLATLAAIASPISGQTAYFADLFRPGWFEWITGDQSANVAADPYNRRYKAHATIASTSGAWFRLPYDLEDVFLRDFNVRGGTGNDFTGEFQNAINQAVAAGCARIRAPSGVIDVSNLVFPRYDDISANALKAIEIVGASMPATQFGTIGTFPVPTTGTIIHSNATTGGSLLSVAPSVGFGTFSWYHIVLRDLNFRTYDNPSISAVDMGLASQLTARNLMIETGVYAVNATKPSGNDSSFHSGLITPKNDNAALTYLRQISVSGYYCGVQINEHTDADSLNLFSFIRGLIFNTANHASRIGRVLACRGTTPIAVAGAHRFSIEQLDIEHSISAAEATNPADLTVGNGYQVTQEDFRDITNGARGYVNWHVVRGYGVSPGPDDTFTINGAAHVQFRQLGEAVPAITIIPIATQSIGSSTSASAVNLTTYGTPEAGVSVDGSDATKINFPRPGSYRVTVRVAFASNPTGFRQCYFEMNGLSVGTDTKNAVNGVATWLTATAIVTTAAAGVGKVKVAQNSGGALNLVSASDAGVVTIEKLRDQQL